MNILILGSGGREHAFAWKIKQSTQCSQLFIAPGNAGTETIGTNLNISPTNFEAIADACLQYKVELVLVGPEDPLVKGIYDYFKNNEKTNYIKVIGPSADAAQLEGSKSFAKDFMKKHNIRTAAYAEFTKNNYAEGVEYLSKHPLPIVLKADGLAAGKGVIICNSTDEALHTFQSMIMESKFGEAGERVVVEEFLKGIEISVFVLTDGKNYVLLPEAKDYKRIGEGDSGLNTGGMGAISPVPFADEAFMKKVTERVIEPTIKGLQKENLEYKGFIFFGLMNTNGDPYVIEYNCRMGDPETEAVIPRIKNDFVDLLLKTSQQRLDEVKIEFESKYTAAIVAVSGGYPGDYEKGEIITGLQNIQAENGFIFHSGTTMNNDKIVTNGGRVLVSVAFGENITAATQSAKQALHDIHFKGMYFRKDIGYEFE